MFGRPISHLVLTLEGPACTYVHIFKMSIAV